MLAFLAAARFAHFVAICLLFGAAAFPFYVARKAEKQPPLRLALIACAGLALLTTALALAAMAANMGGSAASMIDPQVVSAMVKDTRLGQVWVARLGIAAVALALCVRRGSGRNAALLVTSGLLLASVALTGHSGMPGGGLGALHQAADAAHLLAAGWWVGGLFALALTIRALGDRQTEALSRFSGVGYAAVAVIVATGLLKSAILLGSASAIVTTAYGRVLLLKLGLFAGMGLLALSNRFQVAPALKRGDDPQGWAARLQVQVGVEFALGLSVLAVVGALGAMAPPISS